MKIQNVIALSVIFLFMLSCGQSPRQYESDYDLRYEEEIVLSAQENMEETPAINYISSSAAVETNNDTTRKFIRTADLRFKVKDVIKSTYEIENIAVKHNGYVSLSNLGSRIEYVEKTPVNADSTLETTHYTMVNTLILRVPNTKLDTTLKEISRNVEFLDYRIIKANDVALQILSNRLSERRSLRTEQRIDKAIDRSDTRLKDVITAEETAQRKQEQADEAMLANLSLADQINYSTINISIYQREAIKREIISNNNNISAYKPGFGKKVVEAFKTGWYILEEIILLLINIWGLFLIAGILFIAIKLYRKYRVKKKL